MNNISNAAFEFTQEIVAAATEGTALFQKNIHPDIYEEIKGDTIRIDDLRSALPEPSNDRETGADVIQKNNAVLDVFFVAFPETQALENRLAARQRSEDMADAWLLKMFADRTLGERVCDVSVVTQLNDWIKPGTVKMPVCILRLRVNPR